MIRTVLRFKLSEKGEEEICIYFSDSLNEETNIKNNKKILEFFVENKTLFVHGQGSDFNLCVEIADDYNKPVSFFFAPEVLALAFQNNVKLGYVFRSDIEVENNFGEYVVELRVSGKELDVPSILGRLEATPDSTWQQGMPFNHSKNIAEDNGFNLHLGTFKASNCNFIFEFLEKYIVAHNNVFNLVKRSGENLVMLDFGLFDINNSSECVYLSNGLIKQASESNVYLVFTYYA